MNNNIKNQTGKEFNKVTGNIGEAIAYSYLEQNNYRIIRRNYTCFLGEIDIIAEDKSTGYIVFLEVKRRSSLAFGYPREAVNYYKQKKIRQMATHFLKTNYSLNTKVRFDVIDILGDKLTHIKNAF